MSQTFCTTSELKTLVLITVITTKVSSNVVLCILCLQIHCPYLCLFWLQCDSEAYTSLVLFLRNGEQEAVCVIWRSYMFETPPKPNQSKIKWDKRNTRLLWFLKNRSKNGKTSPAMLALLTDRLHNFERKRTDGILSLWTYDHF